MYIVYRDRQGRIIRLKCEKFEARLPNYDIIETFEVPDLELHVLEAVLPAYLSICFRCSDDFVLEGCYRPIFLDMTQDVTFVASGFLSPKAKERIQPTEITEIYPSWGDVEQVYSTESVEVKLHNRTGSIDFPITARVVKTENKNLVKFDKMKLVLGKDFAFKFLRSFSGDWGEEERGQLYFCNIHKLLYKTSFEEKRIW